MYDLLNVSKGLPVPSSSYLEILKVSGGASSQYDLLNVSSALPMASSSYPETFIIHLEIIEISSGLCKVQFKVLALDSSFLQNLIHHDFRCVLETL